MSKAGTKPQGATSYKDTAFGIISRLELLKLEIEGTKKGLEYLKDTSVKDKNVSITPDLICYLHEFLLLGFSLNGQGNIGKFKLFFPIKKHRSIFKCRNLSQICVKTWQNDLSICLQKKRKHLFLK